MDLTLLSALLQELLIKNKRVALPGMGTFVLEDLPSVFLLDGRAITPPSKKVYFRTAEIKSDGALEGAYARKHSVSADKAREAVSLLVKEIRATLIESMQVNIPNFGSISFNESYNFVFTMDDHLNVSADTYPLEAISLKPETAGAGASIQEPHMEQKRVDAAAVQEDELRMKGYHDIISEWHKAEQVQEEEEEFPKVTMQVSEQMGVVDDRMSDPPKYDYGAVDKEPDDLMIGVEEVEILKEDSAGKQDEFSAGCVLDEVETVQRMMEIDETEETFAKRPDDDCDQGYEVVDLSAMEVSVADSPAVKKPREEGKAAVKMSQKEGKAAVKMPQKEGKAAVDSVSGLGFGVVNEKKPIKINKWIWIALVAVVLAVGLLCAVYLFREDLRPVLEKLLYSKEELEILRQTGRM
ncbi:MAG: hypothetical protein RR555_07335 [Bacteroidales bacterium]